MVGFAVSFIPGVPDYQVDPEFVLAVLLPPLLYAAANEASVIAIRRLIRPILQLAVGMVLITALAVAGVLTLIVPDMPFAAALALGAIVAPPDAVAAVAVARRAGLPQHVVTVLEGESLFNDATVAGAAAGGDRRGLGRVDGLGRRRSASSPGRPPAACWSASSSAALLTLARPGDLVQPGRSRRCPW